jgi:hypothetical protein
VGPRQQSAYLPPALIRAVEPPAIAAILAPLMWRPQHTNPRRRLQHSTDDPCPSSLILNRMTHCCTTGDPRIVVPALSSQAWERPASNARGEAPSSVVECSSRGAVLGAQHHPQKAVLALCRADPRALWVPEPICNDPPCDRQLLCTTGTLLFLSP